MYCKNNAVCLKITNNFNQMQKNWHIETVNFKRFESVMQTYYDSSDFTLMHLNHSFLLPRMIICIRSDIYFVIYSIRITYPKMRH